ncbi:MAG: hypothetical protein P4M15_03620 [Alphaproteobacteria bacterium]|nr:hypothetical protein [Alphaproteobacteria bacterium]
MKKYIAFALLALALAGGVAAFSLIAKPIPAHADGGGCTTC